MSITFRVSSVELSREDLGTVSPKQAIEWQTFRAIEACSSYRGRFVRGHSHPLFAAAHLAFARHRPLTLSPDAIWLTIATGVATHVRQNAELLRRRFVEHEGKLQLVVRRDDFVRGSPENPWEEMFAEFSRQIRGHIGDARHEQLVPTFSTTTPVGRAAFEVAFMAIVDSYFEFQGVTLCGIPEVTLTGTVDDWRALEAKVASLAELELEWWTNPLARVMAEFVAAANGHPDPTWWRSIYKEHEVSGGPYITGWLGWLVPYVEVQHYDRATKTSSSSTKRNTNVGVTPGPRRNVFQKMPGELTHNELLPALSCVPFEWLYYGQSLRYELLAGLVGVAEHEETLALEPVVGWAVRPADAPTVRPW